MREIKFRAWDNNRHGYCYFDLFHCWGGLVKGTGIPYLDIRENITEQFTGLRDKNGREIYEGDKVAVFRNGNRTHEIITVEWHDNGYHLPRYISLSMDAYDDMDYEVIGNIHENPEVLK